ncbi:carbohydrate ABC transporter permease [Consotaella aegiceratis]|uniref:carbohydrate ABC transporter permease n=1 Tax=Consotaella aegiceratis TaxID=3097961 RepID=UPI002F420CF7
MKPKTSALGLAFLSPALVLLIALFFAPVALTAIFAFTNMSTSTGIGRGEYVITDNLLRSLSNQGVPADAIEAIGQGEYVVDETGIAQARAAGVDEDFVDEIEDRLSGKTFETDTEFVRALKQLRSKPRSIRKLELAAEAFTQSAMNTRFDTRQDVAEALAASAPGVSEETREQIVDAAYTGPVFTADNFQTLLERPDTWRIILNTVFYVAVTLAFNVLVGLFLAITTFYLPRRTASIFSALWLLPRITPVVLYAIMWKWFTWDNGFLPIVAEHLGLPSFNYMKGSVPTAWTVIILINGFIGASFGLILFSGALRTIPMQQLWASEVDGANRWQQVTRIILPQMRWPILFVTSYQTLSLLSSYEQIWLTTNGGPGSTTTVWALEAFHTALFNYSGNLQYGLGAAMALILVVIGLSLSILYLILFKFDDLVSTPRIEF